MAETKPPTRRTRKPARSKASNGFTAEERAAMKERTRELRAAREGKTDGEGDVLAKIAEMQESDRTMAARIHEIVKRIAPQLVPRTWYGMPAYTKDGNVLCFYQSAEKFKARYGMLGFSDKASLDEGAMWPVYYALTTLTPTEEARIAALIENAIG